MSTLSRPREVWEPNFSKGWSREVWEPNLLRGQAAQQEAHEARVEEYWFARDVLGMDMAEAARFVRVGERSCQRYERKRRNAQAQPGSGS